MSRFRMLVIAISALALSLVVTFLAYRMLSQRMRPSLTATTEVVVAREKIGLGTRITAEQLRIVSWPESLKQEGTFAKTELVVGRGAIVDILPNEPIVDSRLAPKEAGAGLTSAIPEGMRAVAVKVNDVIGVAGFVLPGSRVDVILTGSVEHAQGNDTSKVILENVLVLAAGQNIQRDEKGNPQNVQVITLLVTPDDAQKLALASVDGRIQLALRNPLDLEKADPRPVNRHALYTRASSMPEAPIEVKKTAMRAAPRKPKPADPPPVVTPPQPIRLEVELINGVERKKVIFDGVQKDGTQKWEQDRKQ
jgi:pilus assembly protein CpaB